MTDALGDPGVGAHLAEGNVAGRREHLLLEVRRLREIHGH
jgi:hypothetical protein